ITAYEHGINFFFLTADLHWPLYDGLRKGLARLLKDNPGRRQELVVGVVSYLDNPLFGAFQFHEVIAEVPGLKYVDLLIAGGVPAETSFCSRLDSLASAKRSAHNGARAIGATFHQRALALLADYYDLLDISFIRYNAAHPGARRDLFPYLRQGRTCPVFNFKSVMAQVPRDAFDALGLPSGYWCPDACDYYRFVLSRPEIDGVLCSPPISRRTARDGSRHGARTGLPGRRGVHDLALRAHADGRTYVSPAPLKTPSYCRLGGLQARAQPATL